MVSEEFDYIVVGGGTAGLVLASRLSELDSVERPIRILVLEAGEDHANDPRVLTPAMWPALLNTSADWALETVPQEGLGGRKIKFPQGRLLGGCSGLNGLTFTATSKSNIDAWAQLGNPGWEWSKMLEYFKKSYTLARPPEDAIKDLGLEYVDTGAHGNTGPLNLSFPDPRNDWPQAWLETIKALGFPANGDPFSGATYGANINAESIQASTRQRSFAANAYLEPARARGNVTVITGAHVEKILLSDVVPDDNSAPRRVRADGVQYRKTVDDTVLTVRTRREVLVTAGTIHSPRLLEASGIGDAEILRKHGIRPWIDNPNVGEHLQNHPMCSVSFEVNEDDRFPTTDPIARQDPSVLGAAMEAYSKQYGPFASGGAFASAQLPFPHIGQSSGKGEIDRLLKQYPQDAISPSPSFASSYRAYVESVLTSPTEASAYHISFPGYAIGNLDGTIAGPPPGTENYYTVISVLCHPLSFGSVHIDASQKSGLAIDPGYLSNPLDLEILARHIQYVDQELIKTGPLAARLKKGGKRNAAAPASIDSLDVAKKYVKQNATAAHHFTSTCAMMPREIGGVVDASLNVYGCIGLRVCDASIIPFTTRTNPQATVYAVAEHAADLIKSDWLRSDS